MIKYDRISKCYKIFLNLFGVTVEEFNNILQKVSPIWKNEILSKYKRPGRSFALSLEDMILMVLLYYRSYITQRFISSCLFEVDHSTVSRIIQKLEPLLAKAMPLPKERSLSQEEVMCLIDATEQSIERLRRELERKITIRGRRSGIPSKPRFAQHLKEALFMSDRRFTRPH